MSLLFKLRGYCGQSIYPFKLWSHSAWPPQWLHRSLYNPSSSHSYQETSLLSPRIRDGSRRPFSSSPSHHIRVWSRKLLSLRQGTPREVQRAQQRFNAIRGKTARSTNTHDIGIAHRKHSKLRRSAVAYQRRHILKHHILYLQHQLQDGTERGHQGQDKGQRGDRIDNTLSCEKDGVTNIRRRRSFRLGKSRNRRIILYVKTRPPLTRKSRLPSKKVATPSEMLMYSLGPLAALYTTSQAYTNKVDLSHMDPMYVARHGKATASNRLQACSSVSSGHSTLPSSKRCLQRLLAEYLHSCWPLQLEINEAVGRLQARSANDGALDVVFSDRNVEYICREGYEPEDILSWAWILTANTTDRAIGRLLALVADSNAGLHNSRGVPTFVFLSILRRENWSAAALSKTIVHAWARLEEGVVDRRKQMNITDVSEDPGCQEKQPQNNLIRPMSEHTIVIMVVRLLRQARKVWPEAYIPIVAMLTDHVSGKNSGSMTGPRTPKATARLTFVYNTMLSLLALPTLSPYRSISVQHRAQFNILRRMNQFNPPLAIDREGYRAVTRVQLARRKTPKERDWASLKAKSWPPWKEEKSGLDAHKGPQYGMSGAGEIKKKMEQAGYSPRQWELTADVLAGWDTDRSPTIQKRKLLPRPIMSRRLLGEDELEPSPRMDIWAARIEATRTIDEAWACFLAFKDAKSIERTKPGSQQVYHSMVEKLVFEERRQRTEKHEKQYYEDSAPGNTFPLPLPGDGKEVCEKPGPREAIYVRSSPPSVRAFISIMRRDKVHLSPRLLDFLLIHASSFRAGVRYLNLSQLPTEVVKCLFWGDSTEIGELFHNRVVPPHFFAAFVQFLCRFAPQVRCEGLPLVILKRVDHCKSLPRRINPLQQAFRLMGTLKPYYRPPWNSLLTALARRATSLEGVGPDVDIRRQDILSWTSIQSVIRNMHNIGLGLDLAGFRSVCMGYQKTITACAQDDTGTFLDMGLSFIKRVFKVRHFGALLASFPYFIQCIIPESGSVEIRLHESGNTDTSHRK